MPRKSPYSPEVRERAVKMVLEHRNEYPSEWAAMTSVATELGMTAETLRSWVCWAQVDDGVRPGLTTDERQRMKELEKENKELRRANEMAVSTGGRNELCELL
jgi:transposase